MSKLFAVTGQNNRKSARKRAVDKGILLRESHSYPRVSSVSAGSPSHEFSALQVPQSKQILDPDMLHTLGSGLYEALRIVKQQEWCQLTTVEVCALCVFHKNLGEDMGIPFEALPSSQAGWRVGVHCAQELADWTIRYEGSSGADTYQRPVRQSVCGLCRFGVAEGDRCFPEKSGRV